MITQAEYDRVATLSATNGETPKQPDKSQVAGLSLDYWLATLKAGESTSSTNTTFSAYNRVSGGNLPGFYDIYGVEYASDLGNPSQVANSQLHYGTEQGIFIESQPLTRGSVFWDSLAQSALYLDAKLLVPGYDQNDFGDNDQLVGGSGSDYLAGGTGDDRLYCDGSQISKPDYYTIPQYH